MEGKYGDVLYADKKNKKYPLDTPGRIRAAKAYFAMASHKAKYTPEEQVKIQASIDGAMQRLSRDQAICSMREYGIPGSVNNPNRVPLRRNFDPAYLVRAKEACQTLM